MIESYRNKKALLVGNGVNLLDSSQSLSWGGLLRELISISGIDVDLDNVFKPFPLAFDEMLHQKPGSDDFNDKLEVLKKRISLSFKNQLDGKRGFNRYHELLMSLPYNDILTTNYDYSLQKSIAPDFISMKEKLAINRQESKHSLKRGYFVSGKTIWHMHGELFDSRSYSEVSKYYNEESMMIGYEHYTSYLEKIQENIRGKSGQQKVDNQSLMVRLRNNFPSPYWTDIFFTHNIDIVGQGFDFSENHLWWLINYRANAIRNTKPKYKVKINNKIRFFYPIIDSEDRINMGDPSYFNKLMEKKNNVKKSRAIAEVLKAFKVEPKAIQADSYEDFYTKLTSRELIADAYL